MKKILFLLLITSAHITFAQASDDFFNKADAFFQTYVTNGKVKYAEIKANPTTLDELTTIITNTKVSSSDAKNYQAFYINAYNISVIKGIVSNYPTKSPLNIGGFFDGKKHTIAGEKITLNDLENKKLRAVFPKEARFHFVLVCAGLGCPPIIKNAYKPQTLEKQLLKQTVIAMDNPKFIRVEGKKVKISQIFEWYKKDFTQFGSLVEFINKYKTTKLPEGTKTGFYDYSWSLNDAK